LTSAVSVSIEDLCNSSLIASVTAITFAIRSPLIQTVEFPTISFIASNKTRQTAIPAAESLQTGLTQ
ncbi:hypothetical protein, partial [Microcoleus sp. herbarium12]|uniref:hypothetical protein n=1 Tax=Microcoleus sp. herbarium12 TaxID=3055437 RepID=UPI002FD58BA4